MATIELTLPKFHLGQQVINVGQQVGTIKKMEMKNGEWIYTLDLGNNSETYPTEANIVAFFDTSWHKVGSPSARIAY